MQKFLERLEKKKEYSTYFDYYIAILLGITTVLTAIAAFQGSIWSGNSLTSYNKSVSELNNANALYLEYLTDYSHTELLDLKDDLLYLQWKKTAESDPDKQYLFERLSEGLQKDLKKNTEQSSSEIVEKEKRDTDIEKKYDESEKIFSTSAKLMDDAQIANGNGDKFMFATVLFAIVLFFGGLATATTHFRLKLAYIFLGTIIFLYSFIHLLTLPFP